MHDYLKSGRQAVRLLYFLIIGLAITKAIAILFEGNVDLGAFSGDKFPLFVVFFSFVSRFFLGAYRVLSYDIDIEVKRGKVVMDVLTLLFQALAFYIFSLNYPNLQFSQWMIVIICGVGLIWLVLLAAIFRIMENTSSAWIILNILVVFLVGLNLYLWKNIVFLLSVSLVAAIVDFWFNSDFFFSFKQSPGLRIFVAGPFGDNEPPEKIAENVENARRVGKELALKGHFPFIPHTMLHGWEIDKRFTVRNFKEIDFAWLEFCDALFFIAESPGANLEKEIATKKGLQIFTKLEKVPDARCRNTPTF